MSGPARDVLRSCGARTLTAVEAGRIAGVPAPAAEGVLRGLAGDGLAEELAPGLWLLDLGATPESLADAVAGDPGAYVSGASALHLRGVIDQVPAEVHVSTSRAEGRVATSRGVFRLRRVPAGAGYDCPRERGMRLASAERALFDWACSAALAGRPDARLPECDWPAGFSRSQVARWVAAIPYADLRGRVASLVDGRLSSARG